jgi:sulfur carrier protein
VTSVLIAVNGEPRTVPDGDTVERVVGGTTPLTSGIAVAVNGEVIPRGEWAGTVLRDGDQLEVVTAVQGG